MPIETLSPARLSRATMACQILLDREQLSAPKAVQRLARRTRTLPRRPTSCPISTTWCSANRTRFLADAFKRQVATRNPRVRATFLHHGVIRGTWSIARTAKAATLTMTPFEPLDRPAAALEPEADALLRFAGPGAPARRVVVAVG